MSRKRLVLRGLALLFAALGLLVACSVGELDFANKACPCGFGYVCDTSRNLCVATGSVSLDGATSDGASSEGGAVCTGDSCSCSVDVDCMDSIRTRCGPSKRCVECAASSDNCGVGTFCNASNQCVLGCKQESDCEISPAAPHCNVERHQCVACRTIDDCADADQCSPSGECVEGCDLDAGKLCSHGKQCCQGLCIDTTKDALNCGACGTACSTANGTPACTASTCTWTCAAGFAHCTTDNSGCETNLRTDMLNCGACGKDCNATVTNADGVHCTANGCAFDTCTANRADCDGRGDNGCECSCGTKKNERCCPGNTCNSPLSCNGAANKCN